MPSWTVYAQQAREAEKDRRERAKFGFSDLFDLISTVAGAYTGVKGIQEASKRTDLMQGTQDFNAQQAAMDATETGRAGTWDRAPDDYTGPAPPGEISGPMGRMQFTESVPHEWPEVPGQVHTGGGKYVRSYPEDEPFVGPPPPPVDVPGQVATNWDAKDGWDYERAYRPDAQAGPGQMIDIPGTDYQMDINTSQGRQMVLEMWREQNAGKNPFEAAEGRFKALYGNYPDPEMDAQAEMTLIAAEISAQNALYTLVPPDKFTDILLLGNNIPALKELGKEWSTTDSDVAGDEALLLYVRVLEKRLRLGR